MWKLSKVNGCHTQQIAKLEKFSDRFLCTSITMDEVLHIQLSGPGEAEKLW